MAHDSLTYDDLLRIVELVKSSEQFSEFRLKVGDIEVELRRRAPGVAPGAESPASADRAAGGADAAAQPPALHAAKPADQRAPTAAWPSDAVVIRAPMVGTFYRAPQPGAPPFVEVGAAVEAESVVCIIEVMKLMNSITAGARGTVTHVLVEDAASVETGQPLVVVAPRK